jgi:putative DNA primase/helicase
MTASETLSPAAALELGLSIIPCGPDKKPLLPAWKPFQSRRPTEQEISAWERLNPATWAMITGAVSRRITLDFDGEPGRRILETLNLKPHRRTPSGGFHADFEYPGWHVKTMNSKTDRELQARYPGLDIRGDGGYACIGGHTDRGEYVWLSDAEPYPLEILPEAMREFFGLMHPPAAAPAPTNGNSHAQSNGRVETERLIRMALERAGGDGRNNSGMWLACQLRDNDYSESEARASMRNYCGRVPGVNTKGEREPYTEQEVSATLREVYSRPARDPWGPSLKAPSMPTAAPRDTASTPDLLTQHFSDYGNSQRVMALHGADLRYCYPFKAFLAWEGRRWAVDDGERARNLSQETILEFARQALAAKNESAAKFAAGCLNSQRISNALREAQPHLAIRPAELDTHPDLLNFANGTLNLKTGQLREHRRGDFITRLVHHDYRPDAECPIFLTFLERITANHPGLMGYLQRAFGYSLTGHTIEKAVFLLHGKGDNGKSTLLTAFLKILEEYGVLLQIDTLMARPESNNTQADLADLRGARFVMTSETEEGARIAEGKLKRITQGMGRIKATRKYENPTEFSESHKLWIDANHLPVVRGTDNAIWNRLHPVPFDITIPKAEQDRELPAKLAAEAEGILAWAVAGAVRWYADGLGKPTDVEQAGNAWRAQSDRLGRFIAECCIAGDFAQAKARALYSAYRKWGEEAGERAITETAFANALQERGFTKKHTMHGAVYSGIGLAAETSRDMTA